MEYEDNALLLEIFLSWHKIRCDPEENLKNYFGEVALFSKAFCMLGPVVYSTSQFAV